MTVPYPACGLDTIIDGHLPRATDRIAFRFNDRSVSYASLGTRTAKLAAAYQERFAPGELIGLWLPNGPEMIFAWLAARKAGMIPMPLSPEAKPPEVARILALSRCSCLLVTDPGRDGAQAARLAMGDADIYLIEGDGMRSVTRAGSHAARRAAIPECDPTTALVLHTSGSSGQPKGVMISRAALANIVRGRIEAAAITATSRAVVASSLSHSVGLYQALAYLAAGAEFELLESYQTDRLAMSINRVKPTHLIMVVSAFEALLNHPATTAASFRNIQFAAVGADRVSPQVQRAFRALTGRTLAATYGLTESSWLLINSEAGLDKATALGRPASGARIRLLDENGRDVPPGGIGEIVAKSPRTMTGYLHDPDLTRTIVENGWIRTGDQACIDGDGVYWYVGRLRDIIVLSNGDTVSPVEVEAAILSLPGIADCIVTGLHVARPDTGSTSEVPCAFVCGTSPDLTPAAITAHLAEQLSDYKLPVEFVFLESFPTGISGKISRRELKAWWEAARDGASDTRR